MHIEGHSALQGLSCHSEDKGVPCPGSRQLLGLSLWKTDWPEGGDPAVLPVLVKQARHPWEGQDADCEQQELGYSERGAPWDPWALYALSPALTVAAIETPERGGQGRCELGGWKGFLRGT